jgi:hypothetical protein
MLGLAWFGLEVKGETRRVDLANGKTARKTRMMPITLQDLASK